MRLRKYKSQTGKKNLGERDSSIPPNEEIIRYKLYNVEL